MTRLITLLLLTATLGFAEMKQQYIDHALVGSQTPIVDIRTPGEWKNTGLVKGSIPIVFFNDRGGYDINAFLQELNAKVDTKKEFAMICNSGSRTKIVAAFLSQKLGYKVIDLKGGILYAIAKKIPMEPYKGK
ncbi:MAG: rhodanese-like domain-containing protein [Sulfurimonadaceae bacterium]|nr:rhodanese-like domain-containing protein [Sulfurimonadaceae bacterium]